MLCNVHNEMYHHFVICLSCYRKNSIVLNGSCKLDLLLKDISSVVQYCDDIFVNQ